MTRIGDDGTAEAEGSARNRGPKAIRHPPANHKSRHPVSRKQSLATSAPPNQPTLTGPTAIAAKRSRVDAIAATADVHATATHDRRRPRRRGALPVKRSLKNPRRNRIVLHLRARAAPRASAAIGP